MKIFKKWKKAFVHAVTNRSFRHILFSIPSLLIVFAFAIWWFTPQNIPHNFIGPLRIFDVILFLLVSYIIWHPIVMEVLTWCIASRVKDLPHVKPIPNLRVAFITTIVPQNEPVSMLHNCLPAMVAADYPHDTWVLDEGDSEEVKKICQEYGVKHFSRKGIVAYNTTDGKFTRTKGGNHNSWYEEYGGNYDIVAQIDTDFIPKKDFLTASLGYFRDPKVAFVGTPQIYGNGNASFVAQGASQQQQNFYGAVLRGLSGMGMTLLIGANHILRVSAFQKAGHYTAHITEDLITGMKLHAAGYKSVYIPRSLAIGEGPPTWEAYFSQQLRWAYGCIDILLHHSPKYLRKIKFPQSLYYFFLQQHYFTGIAMVLSLVLLCLYFFLGLRAANVDVFKFFLFYSIVIMTSWLMSVWLQNFDVDKKPEANLLLAGKLISVAVWPIWFLGFLNAFIGKGITYKVTPKGNLATGQRSSLATFSPHFLFSSVAFFGLGASFFTHRQSSVMLFFAIAAIASLSFVPFMENFARAAVSVSKGVSRKVRYFILSSKNTLMISRNGGKYVFPDSLFLFFIVILSCVPYVTRLGFYSDDWSFLGNFATSSNKTLWGLILTATTPNTFMRPMQNVYDALLFYSFGAHPLGYQLVNSGVFIGIVLLLYIVLRKVGLPRVIALPVTLLFSLLPNYSTDRFWYAAYQVNLSILFFLLYTYTGLKAFEKSNGKALLWMSLSMVFLAISILSYEVAIPFVLLTTILFYNPLKRMIVGVKERKFLPRHTIFIVFNYIVLFYLVIFKTKTTTRLTTFDYPKGFAHLFTNMFQTNFIALGIHQPYMWGQVLHQASATQLLFAGCIYLSLFLYLFFTFSSLELFKRKLFLFLMTLSGIVLFVLGYSIFFSNNVVGFSPTGIDNRVAIAATFGIALSAVGLISLISSFIPSHAIARWLFCVLVAIVCTGGFLIVQVLSSYWSSAYAKSTNIVHTIHQHLPTVPNKSTIILDGVCPYVGPGIVFESQWDLKGALQLTYHNPTIAADIVTPRLKITPKGITTQIYTIKAYYPYKNLFVYNFTTSHMYPITNESNAYDYFIAHDPTLGGNCPPAQAGNGVNVF